MLSLNTYCLTWVSLILDMGSLFMAAPAKCSRCSLPWPRGISSIALISHISKVMLKILQARVQEYVNRELPDVQAAFRKGRGTRDQIAKNSLDHRKSKRVPEKTSISALLTMPKPLIVWITINWKILKEMTIPDHLVCLLRNLYAGQEATVRTRHETTDWLQIGKGVCQGCILSSCLFNFYAEYIMRNAGLEEAQAAIKIAGRNINNLRYTDSSTFRKLRSWHPVPSLHGK